MFDGEFKSSSRGHPGQNIQRAGIEPGGTVGRKEMRRGLCYEKQRLGSSGHKMMIVMFFSKLTSYNSSNSKKSPSWKNKKICLLEKLQT